MVLRDADNPATSSLHVTTHFCEALSRSDASKFFEEKYGVKNIVAGPIKVDSLPDGAVLESK